MNYIGLYRKDTQEWLGIVPSGQEYTFSFDKKLLGYLPLYIPEEDDARSTREQRNCKKCEGGIQTLYSTCCAETKHGFINKWVCDSCRNISYIKRK